MEINPLMLQLDAALGNSIIYEERKGNFAEARKLAEHFLAAARAQNDPDQLALALLARAHVHLLQGEPPGAIACIKEIGDSMPLHYRFFADSCNYWAHCLQYNFFPDGGSADGGIETTVFWRPVAVSQEVEQRRRWFRSQVQDPLTLVMNQLISSLLPAVPTSRALFRKMANETTSAPLYAVQYDAVEQKTLEVRQQVEQVMGLSPWLGYIDLFSANLHCLIDRREEATVRLAQARDTYRQLGDAVGVANTYMAEGDWLAAPLSAPEAWNFYIRDTGLLGSALATFLEQREFERPALDLDGALRAYDQAEAFFQQAHAPRGLAAMQLRQGYLAMRRDDYAVAAEYARRAQMQFEQAGDYLGAWTACVHYLLNCIGNGQLTVDSAMAQAIGRWGKTTGSFSFALGLGLLMCRAGRYWLIRAGDYERALACIHSAQFLFEALDAKINIAQTLVDRGNVYLTIGDRSAALIAFEQALDIAMQKMQAPSDAVARIRQEIANLNAKLFNLYSEYSDADGLERIVKRFQQLIVSTAPSGDPLQMVKVFSDQFAKISAGESDYGITDRVTNDFNDWAVKQRAHFVTEYARVMIPLYRGRKAQDDGEVEAANRWFDDALMEAHVLPSARRVFLEASVLAYQKKYSEAATIFRICINQGGPSADFAGKAEQVMQAFSDSLSEEQTRQQLRNTHEMAFTFFTRVRAYAEAKEHWAELERLDGQQWWQQNERPWEKLNDCGQIQEGLQHLPEALVYYDQAIALLEARRNLLTRDELKVALAGGHGTQAPYFNAARAALSLNEMKKTFNYAERGKSRALLDLMASSSIQASAPNSTGRESLRAWREFSNRIQVWRGLLALERQQQNADPDRSKELNLKIEQDTNKLHEIENELAKTHPEFHRLFNPQADVMELEVVCAALPEDTALVQYYFFGEDFLAWAITRAGMVQSHRTAIEAKTLVRQIRQFREACEKQQPVATLGGQLAEILLQPFNEILQQYHRLLIAPFGAAHELPFHALPWQGQSLAATHTLSFLPSASALQFLRRVPPTPPAPGLLAVGISAAASFKPHADAELINFSRIPAAATEAAYVASLFMPSKLLLDSEATEAMVRQEIGQYSILHFATHGYLSDENPLLSAILLANGEALSMYELLGLPLNADLVVLSACRTGQGEVTYGDDVLGLTRGFLGAGARALIVSLWPVDDVSTSLFMKEFYRAYKLYGAAAASLQAAQNYLRSLSDEQIKAELQQVRGELTTARRDVDQVLTIRHVALTGEIDKSKDYSHPYFWAPFVVIG